MPGYAELVNESPDPSKKEDYSVNQKSLDDIMYDEECKRYALAFDQANQVAVFYAYIKLKEQVFMPLWSKSETSFGWLKWSQGISLKTIKDGGKSSSPSRILLND